MYTNRYIAVHWKIYTASQALDFHNWAEAQQKEYRARELAALDLYAKRRGFMFCPPPHTPLRALSHSLSSSLVPSFHAISLSSSCVCVFACLYVCMRVCMRVCVYAFGARMHAHIHTHAHAHTHTHTHTHTRTHTHAHPRAPGLALRMPCQLLSSRRGVARD